MSYFYYSEKDTGDWLEVRDFRVKEQLFLNFNAGDKHARPQSGHVYMDKPNVLRLRQQINIFLEKQKHGYEIAFTKHDDVALVLVEFERALKCFGLDMKTEQMDGGGFRVMIRD